MSKRAASISGIHAAAWLAWLLWVVSATLALSSLFFLFLSGSFERLTEGSVGVDAVVALAFPAVGAVVASRRPGNAIGWLFSAIGLSHAAAVFSAEYAYYALLAEPGSLPAGVAAFWLGSWVWLPGVALTLTYLLLLFPDGRLPSRHWRPVAWLSAGVTALGVLALAVAPWDLLEPGLPADNPFGLEGISDGFFLRTIAIPLFVLVTVCALLCVFSLILRFRRSRGEERQQLKWFLYAGALYLLTVLVPPGAISNLQILTAPLLPVAAGIAILRYRLFDIDLIINRTLVYGSLTASVAALYVLVVGGLGTLLQVRGSLLVSLLATGVVAVLFAPLRDRLQRGVNRLMYGERDDPYGVISRLGERLKATDAPEAVLQTIIETVAGALKLPHAAIALKRDDRFETVAAHGQPKGEPLVLPLAYGTETIGQLVLSPRARGESFGPADRRLLDDLARHAEAAAYAVRLTADLQRSRERLVNAREEERRRLRRDLHDGLGPQLATLTLKLDAARNLLSQEEPAATDALLAELKAQTQAAISDIRRLVYDLRPPALDELGLIPAIREQAANYGLNVSVEAPESLPPLPAAVEVAAYRIVQEALTNVARHARARVCHVRLSLGDELLALEITDDGIGLPEDQRAGVGLSSMRERAAELGGTCVAEPSGPAGGTRVHARLPLEATGFRYQEKAKSREPKHDDRKRGSWG